MRLPGCHPRSSVVRINSTSWDTSSGVSGQSLKSAITSWVSISTEVVIQRLVFKMDASVVCVFSSFLCFALSGDKTSVLAVLFRFRRRAPRLGWTGSSRDRRYSIRSRLLDVDDVDPDKMAERLLELCRCAFLSGAVWGLSLCLRCFFDVLRAFRTHGSGSSSTSVEPFATYISAMRLDPSCSCKTDKPPSIKTTSTSWKTCTFSWISRHRTITGKGLATLKVMPILFLLFPS